MNFVRSNTKRGWKKLPNGQRNKPEYTERPVLEAMVKHFIHHDYTAMGGEVHLDIYNDRLALISPGGMYNGLLIQNLDISDVSSERRNPILANIMAQLGYIENTSSWFTYICDEAKSLEGSMDGQKPVFKSAPTLFQTTIFAFFDMTNVGDISETKLTERQLKMLNINKESPAISGRQMSDILSLSQRTIERDLSTVQKINILRHEGKDNFGVLVTSNGICPLCF